MQNLNNDILLKNMNKLMTERNVSQKQLEADIHITQSTISKYLNGKQAVSLNFLYIFAQYFNVTMDSLCQEQLPASTVDTDNTEKQNPSFYPSFSERIISTCTALAEIFKYGYLKTDTVEKYEVVYREDEQSGLYYRAKGILGTENPTNKYVSLYFSNYWEVATSFESDDEYQDYMTELQGGGNYNELNGIVNHFLGKLADLHSIYMKDSITTESYLRSIDDNLQQLIKSQK